MTENTRYSRRKKRWMIPMAILLGVFGILCLGLLGHSLLYRLPARSEVTRQLSQNPLLDTEALAWVPPTEPEPEPEPEIEPEPEPELRYQLQIDMAKVTNHHNSNHDVVGWVRIQDTVINYPIMQTDNNDFYVDHNWAGQCSHSGAIFADWRCRLDESDNSLLYGHNLANGTMMHAIKNYKVADWGKAHPYIEIASLEHRYLYRVLSVNVIYGELGAKFDYWNYIDMNRTRYNDYVSKIRSTSLVWYGEDSDMPRNGTDRIIALQTCNTGANDGMRCVLFAQCLGDFTNIESYQASEGIPGRIEAPPAEANEIEEIG